VKNDGHRFWNALHDGNSESILNSKGIRYFIWNLRPTVVAALKRSEIA
jgi:hypothetical protein